MTNKYLRARKKARSLYKKIGAVKSPALGDDLVYFTRVGFDHLIRKGRFERSKSEQFRRFGLLKYAKNMVSNPKAIILFRQTEKTGYPPANFWQFVEEKYGRKIKLVVRQIGGGNKHFFSIMAGRIKKSP